jgi:hypothetical protein
MAALPDLDLAAEANDVCVQSVPGAVFVRLRHVEADDVVRRMFVELTLPEAREFVRELAVSIRQAERALRD